MTIHQKMAAIQAEFPTVGKTQRNKDQGYNFRGVDDALAALNPLLTKHGVFLALKPGASVEYHDAGMTKSGKQQVRALIIGTLAFVCGEDNSAVDVAFLGDGIDTGDKSLMKAYSNGLKYSIWTTFAVPTTEKKDSEAFPEPESGPVPQRKTASQELPSKDAEGKLKKLIERVKRADQELLEELTGEVKTLCLELSPTNLTRKEAITAVQARKEELKKEAA